MSDEIVDPFEALKEECTESHHCEPFKVKLEKCTERVEGNPGTEETCVEEFFDQMGNFLGLNYGFVEYRDRLAAETALVQLNGKKVLTTEVRVNWAHAGSANKEDVSNHFHIFVGDLSSEINDQNLAKAFSKFGSMSEARVMWDPVSGKSRGFGFVAFREKSDAEQAILNMNGEWLGSRPIRVNWANQKNATEATSYDSILQQTSQYNTTVYIGNLAASTTLFASPEQDILPLFQQYGYINEVRMQAEKGYAFIKFDTHEHAASAIVALNGKQVGGRNIKCYWGKDRTEAQPPAIPLNPQQQNQQYPGYPYQMPGYGYFQMPMAPPPPQFPPQQIGTDGRPEPDANNTKMGYPVGQQPPPPPPQQWPYYFPANQQP
ncbi:hypothetical protein HK098_007767 [Nowakowskiella sp. JEL0407]|nr:hypothetical protein HK098_007767 [Nowakowskiella sp. JEL0407]